MTKTCTHCGVEKDVSAFHRHRGMPDGLHPWCTACKCAAQGTSRMERDARVSDKNMPHFSRLPWPAGGPEWLAEVWHRAALLRAARPVNPEPRRCAHPHGTPQDDLPSAGARVYHVGLGRHAE